MRLIRLLKNDLARESAEWVDEGLISRAQAEAICTRYGVDYEQARNRSFGYNVLVGLGFLFIGLALITLLGANWDEIPRALRMWGLIAITLGTQALGMKRYLQGDRSGGVGLFLLGNLFFGAAIILIAQIYHLGEYMPDGIFWWALGSLPFAVFTRNPWLAMQSGLLALLWFFIEVSFGFYPALFPLFVLAQLFVLLRGPQSVLLLLLVIASTGFWVEYSLAALWREAESFYLFDLHAEHLAVAAAMFLLLSVFGQWLYRREGTKSRDYAAVISIWCLRFAVVSLVVLGFAGPWEELLDAAWQHPLGMWLVLVLFAVPTLWLARSADRLVLAGALTASLWLAVLAVSTLGDEGYAVYFQVAANFLMVGFGIWLVVRGIHHGISHYFFLGVAAMLVTAFLRYIDLIGDYIGGAAMFAVFALLLLGAARYWKHYQPGQGESDGEGSR
ncbi:DUF2157 domain-containing protein [Microbulbifer yueqingensis]|uniref:Predicted membrane protein n=1 Tax=Microbulbifer yueqingensis TaxID=658219 RepID=A0A1G8UAY4_9GAMM|nr:DUF2157 domain-containing protein [Microbulbifer yueqingensis]SDJ50892.1 Predicted membrane protein [Microbulbifer yueqingensis]